MENTGLASALPIQIGASIGFGLAQDWLIGPNWHALATPQRGMPIHVNPVQSANPRPIQNTAETVRPPDWHGLADWIFKKGEYFTLMIVQSGLAWIGKDWHGLTRNGMHWQELAPTGRPEETKNDPQSA